MVIFYPYMRGDFHTRPVLKVPSLPPQKNLFFLVVLLIVSAWDGQHVLFADICAASLGTPRGRLTRPAGVRCVRELVAELWACGVQRGDSTDGRPWAAALVCFPYRDENSDSRQEALCSAVLPGGTLACETKVGTKQGCAASRECCFSRACLLEILVGLGRWRHSWVFTSNAASFYNTRCNELHARQGLT